ncbi:uncharacterized protein LOC125229638 [Leguminivora glycinivorella]|uniref:uncharacterized protein LOC125229638 n=1 Tax=Leguminivora glycinivorella TaxID=1035111 RepID=UPI00201037C7|nr:uncharacterized protein LOC125229638 [Leguminivora glycinivorella]
MTLWKPIIFLLCATVVTESAFIDTLTKCSIKDGDCLKDLYQTVLQDIGKNGIKELSIPPIDPIELKNVTVNMLDQLEVTMVDGIATGVKNCIFNDFKTELEKEHAWMDLTCDITIKGRYKLKSDSPLLRSIFGKQSIHGDGYAKVKLEQLNLRINYDYFIQRGADGELYFKCKHNETQYTYDIAGRSLFYIDHLYLGDEDLSKYVTTFLNENGKFLLQTFGRSFMDKAMEFFYIFTHRFYDVVPIKHYIIEDLTAYARS